VDLLLLVLSFVSFLRLAVLELAVVHQLADGRLRKRSDFHQIDFGFLGHFQGLGDRHDADLLAGGSDQAHFGRVDLDVDALRSLRGDVASSRKLKIKPYSPPSSPGMEKSTCMVPHCQERPMLSFKWYSILGP